MDNSGSLSNCVILHAFMYFANSTVMDDWGIGIRTIKMIRPQSKEQQGNLNLWMVLFRWVANSIDNLHENRN